MPTCWPPPVRNATAARVSAKSWPSSWTASGTKLAPFSPAIMDASFNAANEVYAETTAKNAAFKKVYESMVAFRKDAVLWFRVGENSFDNFMARQSAASKL